MNNKILSFLFIFFPTFLCIFTAVISEGCFMPNHGYFINVVNHINDGGDDHVLVHCQSRDDDIGEKTIRFNQNVAWKFCENIFSPITLFYCHFNMNNNKHQLFDVFNETVKPQCVEKPERDPWRCTWLIKRDGFYFVHRGDTYQEIKVHNWL